MAIDPIAAQTGPDRYWIQFSDKDGSGYTLENPSEFLSPRAIEKRARLGIGYNELDIPVSEIYVQQVLELCNCMVLHRSKWFNSITIYTTDSTIIEEIAGLPFVISTRRVMNTATGVPDEVFKQSPTFRNSHENSTAYGESERQLTMMNAQFLHGIGLTGGGVHVAVFDAGWHLSDKLPCFDHILQDNRLLGVRDFVFGGEEVFNSSAHGTYVWSIMSGMMADSLHGSAPGASYYLFRTEDPFGENIVEEDNWVAAMELSDSLGVDVVNSSLGYSLFDNPEQNHSYEDMDGNTARCSIAGDIAASKGILVVNSAGNSGSNPWHYITAPSDGDSVLCIGAVDESGIHAAFSSFGPSSDGDVKPDVSAMGLGTAFAGLDSTIWNGNGTSFSSPLVAGLATCLWQAFPNRSNMEIFHAIRQSAHLYDQPNDSLGHGIPDFREAYQILAGTEKDEAPAIASIWPTLTTGQVNILLRDGLTGRVDFKLFQSDGALVDEWYCDIASTEVQAPMMRQYSNLAPGTYLLSVHSDSAMQTTRLLVVNTK